MCWDTTALLYPSVSNWALKKVKSCGKVSDTSSLFQLRKNRMKAVLMTAAGEPEVLQLQDVPEPKIQKDTEILVRLTRLG